MRLLIELLCVAALIAVGWEKPLKERFALNRENSSATTHSQVTPAPTVSGAWMWDPSHKNALDPPKKHATATPH